MSWRRLQGGKAERDPGGVGDSRSEIVVMSQKPCGRAGRRWPLEVAVAVVLTAAATAPLIVKSGATAAPPTSEDFRSVATRLVKAGEVQPSDFGDLGSGEVRVRKNAKDLGPGERKKFVEAVIALKRAKSPFDEDCAGASGPSSACLSYYDQFVQWHKDLYRCDPVVNHVADHHGMSVAHGSPVFLPWHRLYLLMFEKALRDVSGNDVTVPYWDWTDPLSTSSVFSEDLMGLTGDADDAFIVKSGPFKKDAADTWKLRVHPEGAEWSHSASDYLTRRLTGFEGLPSAKDVASALAIDTYDTSPYDTRSDPARSFRNTIEGFRGGSVNNMECGPDGWMTTVPITPTRVPGKTSELPIEPYRFHNDVHTKVGGILAPKSGGRQVFGTMMLPTSPNDPVFFLHHANVDRLWAEWQAAHGVLRYQPSSGHPGKNADDVMEPFASEAGAVATPRSVEDLSQLGYRYK